MRATTAIVVVGSLATVAAEVSAAQAVPAGTATLKVVKVVTRHRFGKMLANLKGLSLYYIPSNKCNTACLKFWPPLLMPKSSKANPAGTTCLSTLKFGKTRRQVTYRGHRLYTFTEDHGTSVNGNHNSGFLVAKVVAGGCPKQVVKVVTRQPTGVSGSVKMLASTLSSPGVGLSLYYLTPGNTCTGQCLGFWPPLGLPKGSTEVPTGTTCLGTVNMNGMRQITYRGHPLYTFYADSGTMASGNGTSGFVVARVKTGAC
jgi:predicted lipoprotein with Yx(FWY)xxD motif